MTPEQQALRHKASIESLVAVAKRSEIVFVADPGAVLFDKTALQAKFQNAPCARSEREAVERIFEEVSRFADFPNLVPVFVTAAAGMELLILPKPDSPTMTMLHGVAEHLIAKTGPKVDWERYALVLAHSSARTAYRRVLSQGGKAHSEYVPGQMIAFMVADLDNMRRVGGFGETDPSKAYAMLCEGEVSIVVPFDRPVVDLPSVTDAEAARDPVGRKLLGKWARAHGMKRERQARKRGPNG